MYPKQIEILVVRKIFYTLIFSITIFSAYAQTAAYKEKFSDADYYFLFEEYGKALKLFQELYTKDQKNANINYLIGLCYIQSIKDKEKVQAIPYLEYATQFINPKYKEGKYKETQAPVYSLYYLAFAYRLDKKFEKAIECFTKATEIAPQFDYPLHNLGTVSYDREQLDQAMHYFHQSLELNENNFATLNDLGCALYLEDKVDEALVFLKKALIANNNYRLPYHNIGYIAFKNNLL